MKTGEIDLDYIRTHKMCQDHAEHWFCAIRHRFAFCMYPNPLMFMEAFRMLLVRGAKGIYLRPGAANCIAQDETTSLKVGYTSSDRMQMLIQTETKETVETELVLEDNLNQEVVNRDIAMRSHNCNFTNCTICSVAISYIAGYYVYIISKSITCLQCKLALKHSPMDPCSNDALIRFKDYCPDDEEKGLQVPSGSLCKLLFHCDNP